MKKNLFFGFLALISFAIGANIYTDIRGYKSGLFKWVDFLFPVDLTPWSKLFLDHSFLLYNLPDALWLFSLQLVLLIIWDFQFSKSSVLWLLGVFCFATFLELLQLIHLIKGTYDANDLISYALASIIALIILINNSINGKAKSKYIVTNGNNNFWWISTGLYRG